MNKHTQVIRDLPEGVLVDDQDMEQVKRFNWRVASHGYVVSTQNKRQYLHRFLMNAPKGMMVDHINGNRLDNRRSNLRLCSGQQNPRNSAKHRRNKTGYKGVFLTPYGTFQAAVTISGKKVHLGTFSNSLDAAKAYDAKVLEAFGEFARPNMV